MRQYLHHLYCRACGKVLGVSFHAQDPAAEHYCATCVTSLLHFVKKEVKIRFEIPDWSPPRDRDEMCYWQSVADAVYKFTAVYKIDLPTTENNSNFELDNGKQTCQNAEGVLNATGQ